METVRLLLDSRAMQTQVHLEDGVRLDSLIKALESAGAAVAFSADRLDADGLRGVDVVLIPTRTAVEENEFSISELTALERFTANGGGLLLMSNHGDLPGVSSLDLTRHDRVLAARFGVDLQPAWFQTGAWNAGILTTLGGDLFSADHPIISGTRPADRVGAVVTNNCAAMARGVGTPLISLAPSMVDSRAGLAASQYLFGCALDGTAARRGRVVVLTDSGFIGSAGTTRPGPGLIDQGDNLRFVLNTIEWLGAS